MDKTVEAFTIQRQTTSHIEEQCVFGKLRGLYGQWPKRQPTACASNFLAKNGHHHQGKGHECHQERWSCQASVGAIGDGAHAPQTEQTKPSPEQLALEEIQGVMMAQLGEHGAGAVKHCESYRQQKERKPE